MRSPCSNKTLMLAHSWEDSTLTFFVVMPNYPRFRLVQSVDAVAGHERRPACAMQDILPMTYQCP